MENQAWIGLENVGKWVFNNDFYTVLEKGMQTTQYYIASHLHLF